MLGMDQITLQSIYILCCVSHLSLTSSEGAIRASANPNDANVPNIYMPWHATACLVNGEHDVLSHSLLQAARKRPALANMLIHPWLAPPTPGAPLPTPQLQLTTAPSSPGPSPLGLAPTECGPHTPMPVEGRQHQGMSPCTTASEETMLSCEMATPDTRCVSSPLHSLSGLTLCMWLLWAPVSKL